MTSTAKLDLLGPHSNPQENMQKLLRGLVANGIPRSQAIALVASIDHCLNSRSFLWLNGEDVRDSLIKFVETVVQ